jgi:hypothetical protein
MAGACLTVAGLLGCPLKVKEKEFGDDNMQSYSCYNSQNLDVENVKIETKM